VGSGVGEGWGGVGSSVGVGSAVAIVSDAVTTTVPWKATLSAKNRSKYENSPGFRKAKLNSPPFGSTLHEFQSGSAWPGGVRCTVLCVTLVWLIHRTVALTGTVMVTGFKPSSVNSTS